MSSNSAEAGMKHGQPYSNIKNDTVTYPGTGTLSAATLRKSDIKYKC